MSASYITIRSVLDEHAKLDISADDLGPETNLYEAGLSSLSTVNVMLAIEDALDIEFPESMLNRRTFESIASIADALEQLQVA
jgi:acyl carrier protein